jgi:hypothetical protein
LSSWFFSTGAAAGAISGIQGLRLDCEVA